MINWNVSQDLISIICTKIIRVCLISFLLYSSNKRKVVQCSRFIPECVDPLGMEDRRIQDNQITSSTAYDANHAAYYARLNRPASGNSRGAWCTTNTDSSPWIQVDLGVSKNVSGIVLQGRADYDRWVTKYMVNYSDDGISWLNVESDNPEDDRVRNDLVDL